MGMKMNAGRDPRLFFREQSVESRDLWEVSQKDIHPDVNVPGTVANYVSTSQVKVPDRLPSNTFKGGFYPHTYTTLNFEENAEPTSAPFVQNLSPLEFASLGRMNHVLPPRWKMEGQNRPTTFFEGLDTDVTGQRRWRTSDAQKKKTRVGFQPYTKTSTSIANFPVERQNTISNKSILSGPVTADEAANEEYQQRHGFQRRRTARQDPQLRK
jgi:hypothetical protein